MSIFVSNLLKQDLDVAGPTATSDFAMAFRAWYESSEARRRKFENFGRDKSYDHSFEEHGAFLRHVHTQPSPDDPGYQRWMDQWHGELEKTSDSVLVYCKSVDEHDVLLIYFMEEGAHCCLGMSARGDRNLRKLARIGAAWRMQPNMPNADWTIVLVC